MQNESSFVTLERQDTFGLFDKKSSGSSRMIPPPLRKVKSVGYVDENDKSSFAEKLTKILINKTPSDIISFKNNNLSNLIALIIWSYSTDEYMFKEEENIIKKKLDSQLVVDCLKHENTLKSEFFFKNLSKEIHGDPTL